MAYLPEPQPEIELADVCKRYGEKRVLEHFSLKIFAEEFIAAIGSSGCGKTTALKLMNGLIAPDSGKVLLQGRDIAGLEQNLLRRKIGYVIQGVGLFPHMRVRDNIAYVLTLSRTEKSTIRQKIQDILKVVNLTPDLLERYPHELSGGQKQRVGIARALVAKPKIVLMDEPFGAVDDITRRRLQAEMKRIHEELRMTVFFITHDITEALKLGSRILIMDKGKIEQFDTPDAIRTRPASAYVSALLGSKTT